MTPSDAGVGVALLGFGACALIWAGAVTAIQRLWARQRAVRVRDLARRHAAGWTAFFFVAFIAGFAAGFALPFLNAFAVVLAVAYAVFEGRQLRHQYGIPMPSRRETWVEHVALAVEWIAYLLALLWAAVAVVTLVGV